MAIFLIIFLVVAILIIILIFSFLFKKCVTYKDPSGGMVGGCFNIWQKGWWSGEVFSGAIESKGYKLLTNVSEFPEEYREALSAVIDKLKNEEDNPDDYYVKIKEYDANVIIISLIHKDSFKPKDANKIVAGNPSGKDRSIYYNLDLKIITKDLLMR